MNKLLILLIALVSISFSFEEDTLIDLKKKSESYFAKYKRAKIELFFDQPKYAPGDTVRFRATYLRAGDLKPVTGKQIVHVSLFDQTGKKTMTQWASVTNGWGNNEMIIPSNFPQGNYVLVAYTEWMKNFDPSLFFQQQFEVSGKYAVTPVQPNDSVIFYPEGGSLIAGIENNLAIRYVGARTKISVKENGNEMTTLNPSSDSVMQFRFVPKLKTEYVAELQTLRGIKKINLPVVNPSGVSLQVDVLGNQIKVDVACYGLTPLNKDYYIALFNANGLIYNSQLVFDSNQKASAVLPSNLSRGIAQLIFFDPKFNQMASRVIYLGSTPQKNVLIDNLKDSYATRQAVTAGLKITDREGFGMPGLFSYRVVNTELFPSSGFQEMSYLTFQSDISNTFQLNKSRATLETINAYLITQTCPWFNWEKIINEEKTSLTFKPEHFLNMTGKALFAKNNQPVKDSTLVMFFLEKSLYGYEAYTNSKGEFSFPLLLSINRQDRFFYASSRSGNDLDDITIKVNDPDSAISFKAKPWISDKNKVDPYAVYSAQKNAINKSFSFFINKKALNDSIDEPNKPMEDELNGADFTTNLSDFLQMPTMEDVAREILRAVEYRKINGRHVMRVYTSANRKPNNYMGPLFVIDGTITKDPVNFISLKPADVISVKVVRNPKKLFALGKIGENGVILVKTKSRSAQIKEKHMIDFSGLLPESRISSSPNANPQLPNLKSCLFWSPKMVIKGNEELSFTTSDDVGDFKIQISGITDDGVPFYSEHPFSVKFAGN